MRPVNAALKTIHCELMKTGGPRFITKQITQLPLLKKLGAKMSKLDEARFLDAESVEAMSECDFGLALDPALPWSSLDAVPFCFTHQHVLVYGKCPSNSESKPDTIKDADNGTA